jgi:hypothetical protein
MLATPIGDFTYDTGKLYTAMSYGQRMLDQVANELDLPVFEFDELEYESTCKKIFETLLPYEHDAEHWRACAERNIQINVEDYIRYYHANLAEIAAFKSMCWSELRSLARAHQWHH